MLAVKRRDFLRSAAASAGVVIGFPLRPSGLGLGGLGLGGLATQAPDSQRWREFDITTRVEVLRPAGRTRIWLPAPLAVAPYQRTLGDTYRADGGMVEMVERPDVALDMLIAEWPDGIAPLLKITSRVATTDYRADLAAGGADVQRARGVYESIVSDRSPDTNPRDLNRIFVELVEAMGMRARKVFGLSLSSANATRAQQIRAEVDVTDVGWVPVDLGGQRFGSWTSDWVAFNYALNVSLPGAKRGSIGYFMLPYGETANGRIDNLDAEAFRYEITVNETT
jgi:hypothetical protein